MEMRKSERLCRQRERDPGLPLGLPLDRIKQNGSAPRECYPVDFIGRDGGIRTRGPLHPISNLRISIVDRGRRTDDFERQTSIEASPLASTCQRGDSS